MTSTRTLFIVLAVGAVLLLTFGVAPLLTLAGGPSRSGLVDGLSRLRGIPGFAAVELTRADIVRHPIVQQIVNAYERRPGKRH